MSSVPPPARELFDSLCGNADRGELAELRERVRAHVGKIAEAAEKNELLPVDLAEKLGEALEALLHEAPSLDPAHRALIVGAARYFVSVHDHVADTSSELGLDDDIAVFNHAVCQMGRDDLVLPL